MQPVQGTRLDDVEWFSSLRLIEEISFFEGPLLTIHRAHQGLEYLRYWCDCDNDVDRWLLCGLGQLRLEEYRKREISLRELLLSPVNGFLYCIDTSPGDRVISAVVANPKSIPPTYFPDDGVYYETADRATAPATTSYDIKLRGGLSLEDLQKLPRVFSQAYSLLFWLRATGPHASALLKPILDTFPWRGGFSRMHFYSSLGSLKSGTRITTPDIVSIHYASPGWIELELDVETAWRLRELVDTYITNAGEVSDLVKSVNRGLSKRKLRGHDGKSISDTLSSQDSLYCEAQLAALVSLMGLRTEASSLKLAINPLASLKILLSFLGRLETLACFHIQEKASF